MFPLISAVIPDSAFFFRGGFEGPSLRELHGRHDRARGPGLHGGLCQMLLLCREAKVRSVDVSNINNFLKDPNKCQRLLTPRFGKRAGGYRPYSSRGLNY